MITTPTSWRQVLKRYRTSFGAWLRATHRDKVELAEIASQLEDFLVSRIDRAGQEWPEAPIEFWNRIPDVLSCCSDLETFEKPLAVEAYAYVHFLERYRRTWATMAKLMALAVLPMGNRGVRVLDVGTGPACSLYAIDDFYAALREFANVSDIPELSIPAPELACVEKTKPMVWFFHEFSERIGRRGPFDPIADDFLTLDLSEMRDRYRSQHESERYWDDETEQYEELYDPAFAEAEAERLFRYRLVFMSNFLTAETDVDRFRESLLVLFEDLKAGGVVVVLGGTGDDYQRIYEQVAAIAKEAGLTNPTWEIDKRTRLGRSDESARIIKEAQHRVYQHIADMVGSDRLQRGAAWPDYWRAEPSRKARPKFAFRVFRSGRWPTGRSTARHRFAGGPRPGLVG